jgi:hypothetical protein
MFFNKKTLNQYITVTFIALELIDCFLRNI